MRFLKSPKADAIVVAKKLLKQLNVKVSSITVQRSLADHPDFPSLLAISDCLTEWGVENKTYQIKKQISTKMNCCSLLLQQQKQMAVPLYWSIKWKMG